MKFNKLSVYAILLACAPQQSQALYSFRFGISDPWSGAFSFHRLGNWTNQNGIIENPPPRSNLRISSNTNETRNIGFYVPDTNPSISNGYVTAGHEFNELEIEAGYILFDLGLGIIGPTNPYGFTSTATPMLTLNSLFVRSGAFLTVTSNGVDRTRRIRGGRVDVHGSLVVDHATLEGSIHVVGRLNVTDSVVGEIYNYGGSSSVNLSRATGGDMNIYGGLTGIEDSTVGRITANGAGFSLVNSTAGDISITNGSLRISGSSVGSVSTNTPGTIGTYQTITNTIINGSFTCKSAFFGLINSTVHGGIKVGDYQVNGSFNPNSDIEMTGGIVSGTFAEALGGSKLKLERVSAQNLSSLNASEDNALLEVISSTLKTQTLQVQGNATVSVRKSSPSAVSSSITARDVFLGNTLFGTPLRPGVSTINFEDSTLTMENGGRVIVGNSASNNADVVGNLNFVGSNFNGDNSTVSIGTGTTRASGNLSISRSSFVTTGETTVGDFGSGSLVGSTSSTITLGNLTIGNRGLGSVNVQSSSTLTAKGITIGKVVPVLSTGGGYLRIDNASVLMDSGTPTNILVGSSLSTVSGGNGELMVQNSGVLRSTTSAGQPKMYVGVNGLDGKVSVTTNGRIEISATEVGSAGSIELKSDGDLITRTINLNEGQISMTGLGTQLLVNERPKINGTLSLSDRAVFQAVTLAGTVGDNGVGVVRAISGSKADGLGDVGVGSNGFGTVVAENSTVAIKTVGKNAGTGVVSISRASTAGQSSIGSIGDQGTGTVNLRNGALVNSSQIKLGVTGSAGIGFGRLNLDGAGTKLSNISIENGVTGFGFIRVGAGSELSSSDGILNGTYGTISGGGTILANVLNSGTISPGDSPGRLTINGNLTQVAGIIDFEIGGLVSGQYDELLVNGVTTVTGGTIRIRAANGFDGAGLTSLQLFRGGTLNISSLVQIENTTGWNARFNSATGQLQAVPEPATMSALAFMFAGIATRKRKRLDE